MIVHAVIIYYKYLFNEINLFEIFANEIYIFYQVTIPSLIYNNNSKENI